MNCNRDAFTIHARTRRRQPCLSHRLQVSRCHTRPTQRQGALAPHPGHAFSSFRRVENCRDRCRQRCGIFRIVSTTKVQSPKAFSDPTFLDRITGRPHAIASRATMPYGSYREGNMNTSAERISIGIRDVLRESEHDLQPRAFSPEPEPDFASLRRRPPDGAAGYSALPARECKVFARCPDITNKEPKWDLQRKVEQTTLGLSGENSLISTPL